MEMFMQGRVEDKTVIKKNNPDGSSEKRSSTKTSLDMDYVEPRSNKSRLFFRPRLA
jgi:hypothetical protein